MQLTAELKPIEELKSLPTFEREYEFEGIEGNLKFTNDSITVKMLNNSNIELKWDKKNKRFVSSNGMDYNYSLDWLTNITVSDDKLKLSLEINDLTLTVKILKMDDSLRNNGKLYKSHKDKFRIVSDVYLAVYHSSLFIHGTFKDKESASRQFESKKALVKWIRNLLKCMAWTYV